MPYMQFFSDKYCIYRNVEMIYGSHLMSLKIVPVNRTHDFLLVTRAFL